MDTMTEDAVFDTGLFEQERAINQLKSEGNPWPDTFEIRDRMAANAAAKAAKLAEAKAKVEAAKTVEAQPKPPEPMPVQPTPKPKRKRGRPPKNPLWLQEVANSYAQGLPLGRALRKVGVTDLSESQRKGIYRLKRFQKLVESYRGEYFGR